jgi:hypothetical protein
MYNRRNFRMETSQVVSSPSECSQAMSMDLIVVEACLFVVVSFETLMITSFGVSHAILEEPLQFWLRLGV